jgi:tetratricopeptide (TPR) repeat protein
MNFIKKNPRRSVVLGSYLAAIIICVPILHLSGLKVLLALVVLTAALLLAFLPSVLAIYGNLLFAQGKDEKAVEILKIAFDRNTPSPAAHMNYAIWLLRQGNGAQALTYLDKARKLAPDIMAQKNIDLTSASCHWNMGNVDKAVEILEEMRTKYEYVNAHVLSTLGYMLFLQGNLERSEEVTNQALEDDPSLSSAWDNLGQLAYKKNDMEQAEKHFKQAISFKADLPDSLYYLALIRERENGLLEAVNYLERAKACKITALNTVTRDQVESKLDELRPLLAEQELQEDEYPDHLEVDPEGTAE